MIDTLESVNGRALRDYRSPLDFVVKRFWGSTALPPFQAIADGSTIGTIPARVNHGRWIVDCPVPSCPGCSLASETDPRFVCCSCGSGPWSVEWPAERQAIEEVLARRPVKETRNWERAEAVNDLVAENIDRGVDPKPRRRSKPRKD